MPSVSRALRLPVLAVCLPCAFIGLLGYKWLELERDAAARRSVEAAVRESAALRADLVEHLTSLAQTAARVVSASGAELREPLPAGSTPMIAAVYLFDGQARLVAPDAATAAAEVRTAAALLARARDAAGRHRREEAEKHASMIARCCPRGRDEFGVAYVWYAAWLRAGLEGSGGAARGLDGLTRELMDLAMRGFLDTDADAIEAMLLARKLPGHAMGQSLVQAVDEARERSALRRVTTASLASWIAHANLSTLAATTVRSGTSDALAVAVRTSEDRIAALLLARDPLEAWIRSRAGHSQRFHAALARDENEAASATFVTPLFPEAPLLRLVLHPVASDPLADRARQRLFVAAIAGALVLTLVVGYLGIRDVSREIRLAATRASFVAAVTHELRTPLSSIRLLAETLRWGRARPETAPELLDTIVDEADRLGRLVDNVLSSSRIKGGTYLYTPKIVVVVDAVHEAVSRFGTVLRREGFELAEQADDPELVVRVDRDAFGQAVLNLLSNAVKYSGSSRRIRVGVRRSGDSAVVSVADEGIGIAQEEHPRIFDLFYRTPEAVAESGGAGLGLALVRHFAEWHGGRVTVESAQGTGSVFSVWLPLAELHAQEPAVAAHG